MTLPFFPDPALLPEQLEDGRLRCKRCGAAWYPMLNGAMQPYSMRELACTQCEAKDEPRRSGVQIIE